MTVILKSKVDFFRHVYKTRNSPGDEIPERDRVPKFGVGTLAVGIPPKTTNAARFYLLLLLV